MMRWFNKLFVALALMALPSIAFAQSTCSMAWFAYGYVPTATQWQTCWNSKLDVSALPAAAAFSSKTIASPTAPNSTSAFKMQGLAGAFTPASTGNVLIIISGTIVSPSGTSANLGVQYQISYGTGTAPTSNATLAGTQAGVIQEYTNPTTVTAADVHVPFSVSYIVTGLTIGTTYWIDLAAESVTTASDMGFANVSIVAAEQ